MELLDVENPSFFSFFSSAPPFQDVFPGKGESADASWRSDFGEGNICLNQRRFSQKKKKKNRGETFKEKGFCLRRRDFLSAEFPRAGKEGRKEIKAHSVPREKEQKKPPKN